MDYDLGCKPNHPFSFWVALVSGLSQQQNETRAPVTREILLLQRERETENYLWNDSLLWSEPPFILQNGQRLHLLWETSTDERKECLSHLQCFLQEPRRNPISFLSSELNFHWVYSKSFPLCFVPETCMCRRLSGCLVCISTSTHEYSFIF